MSGGECRKVLRTSNKLGRLKREGLRYLKERIMKKLHGWKTFFLNNAGKKLIKAVITAILTYVMTLFRLPKTSCEDIARLLARFSCNGRDAKKNSLDERESIDNVERYGWDGVIMTIHLNKTPGEDILIWPTTVDGKAIPNMVYRRIREVVQDRENEGDT